MAFNLLNRRDLLKLLALSGAGLVFQVETKARGFALDALPLNAAKLIGNNNTVGSIASRVQGYTSVTSILAGHTFEMFIRVSESVSVEPVLVEIFRKGRNDVKMVGPITHLVPPQTTPIDADQVGAGWTAPFDIFVHDDWGSGFYVARLTCTAKAGFDSNVYDVPFIVKSKRPGISKILVVSPVTTYLAYNNWGNRARDVINCPPRDRKIDVGKSMYGGFPNVDCKDSELGDTNYSIYYASFDRPYSNESRAYFEQELEFIAWLDAMGIEVEHCTSIDFHQDPSLLLNYNLFVSVGHDEYWSYEMRQNVERFRDQGGNIAFLSANVCYWQVRFRNAPSDDENLRIMWCYREASERLDWSGTTVDPYLDIDNTRVTTQWANSPVNRAENALTGVRSSVLYNGKTQRRDIPYYVETGNHWVFERLGLEVGSQFGEDQEIIGRETDSVDFSNPTTPANFTTLAQTEQLQMGWDELTENPNRSATLGTYRTRGVVLTVGTIDWVRGLSEQQPINAISQITLNILRTLGTPRVTSLMPYQNGIIATFNEFGIFYSPDGQHLRGGGITKLVYDGAYSHLAMIGYRQGILTAFSSGDVYFSPDGANLGRPASGNTKRVSQGRQVKAMYPHDGGVIFVFEDGEARWFSRPDTSNTNNQMVYSGVQKITTMLPYKKGMLTAFDGGGLYFSPDGFFLGGGNQHTTLVFRSQHEIVYLTLYRETVLIALSNGQVFQLTQVESKNPQVKLVSSSSATVLQMLTYGKGLVIAYSDGYVFYSPDGQNLRGSGRTRLLTNAAFRETVISLVPFRTGIMVAYADGSVYFSPDAIDIDGSVHASLVFPDR